MYKAKSGRGPVVRSKPLSILKGVLCGYIITMLMLFLLAYLLLKFDISSGQTYIGIVITYILSTLITGLIVGKSINQNAWLWGCLSGFLYFLILIVVSAIINKDLATVKELFTMLALCVGGGTLGGMFS
jgi:putative membrane protein (TIGR04086 family)